MVNSICFTVLLNQNFILFIHKYLFNISTTAILQLRILQNSCFAKHLSLTASYLYGAHLDDSGREYTFWLRNIFCANGETIFPASPLMFSELIKGRVLHYRLHCLCFISFPSVHTSLIMFHFYFLQSTVHLIHFICHSPSRSYFTLFGCIHITWSFNFIVSFTFQPIRSLEINDLRVSLDKFLIWDRCSLLEAELPWFYYSLSLYMKQEIQHRTDLIWWLKTTLHPLIILAVKKLMSLRNMKLQ